MSKTRASCFITGSKHLETSVSRWLEPVVFGTRDEALALVFDILRIDLVKVLLDGKYR